MDIDLRQILRRRSSNGRKWRQRWVVLQSDLTPRALVNDFYRTPVASFPAGRQRMTSVGLLFNYRDSTERDLESIYDLRNCVRLSWFDELLGARHVIHIAFHSSNLYFAAQDADDAEAWLLTLDAVIRYTRYEDALMKASCDIQDERRTRSVLNRAFKRFRRKDKKSLDLSVGEPSELVVPTRVQDIFGVVNTLKGTGEGSGAGTSASDTSPASSSLPPPNAVRIAFRDAARRALQASRRQQVARDRFALAIMRVRRLVRLEIARERVRQFDQALAERQEAQRRLDEEQRKRRGVGKLPWKLMSERQAVKQQRAAAAVAAAAADSDVALSPRHIWSGGNTESTVSVTPPTPTLESIAIQQAPSHSRASSSGRGSGARSMKSLVKGSHSGSPFAKSPQLKTTTVALSMDQQERGAARATSTPHAVVSPVTANVYFSDSSDEEPVSDGEQMDSVRRHFTFDDETESEEEKDRHTERAKSPVIVTQLDEFHDRRVEEEPLEATRIERAVAGGLSVEDAEGHAKREELEQTATDGTSKAELMSSREARSPVRVAEGVELFERDDDNDSVESEDSSLNETVI